MSNKEKKGGGDEGRPVSSVNSQPEMLFGAVKNRSPHAAYRLGYLSRAMLLVLRWVRDEGASRSYRSRFLEYAGELISKFREDCRYLASEFDPKVIGPLDATQDSLCRQTGISTRESIPGSLSSGMIGTTEVPDELAWRELCRLADDALPPGHALRTLYEFGAALGEYELALPRRATMMPLMKRDPPARMPASALGLPDIYDESPVRKDGPLPDLVPLLHAASNLPPEVVERVASLGQIARFIRQSAGLNSPEIPWASA
jgi:hypothetical protein